MKVGGASEGGKCFGEKDEDEEKGIGIGKEHAEERVEGKGKA